MQTECFKRRGPGHVCAQVLGHDDKTDTVLIRARWPQGNRERSNLTSVPRRYFESRYGVPIPGTTHRNLPM